MKRYAPPRNRIGRIEGLVMNLRDDPDALVTLEAFPALLEAIALRRSNREILNAVADMIEEVLEAE